MLRWLTATGTFLSLLAFIRLEPKTRTPRTKYGVMRWSIAVRRHNQFGSWT
jgi:hypothetical protein